MKKFKKALALLLTASMLFVLSACGSSSSSTSSTKSKIDEIKEAGVLVVGTSADYPPYEFHTEIDGVDTIVGFDISFSQYFADALGVELEVVDMSFDNLLIGLSEGQFDLVMAGLTPTEERKESVDFTDIIFSNPQIVIVRTEDKDIYTTTDSLSGHYVGVQKGTIQEDIAADLTDQDDIISLVTFSDLIIELKEGKIDAICTNYLTAAAYVAANDDLTINDIGIEYEDTGFAGAVQKGNEDFVEYLNGLIQEMKDKGLIDQYIVEAEELAGIESVDG
ncbi:MAG: transporter substrate-binding domain-containing protein [Oscillospiraceae bacterium]|jgi:ABC-type amino acid transport substrate-binding protein